MKHKIFTGFLSIALFAFTSLNARHEEDSRPQREKSRVGKGQGHCLCHKPYPEIYSAPGRIDCTGNWDAFLSASFIYWHVSQECLEYALLFDPTFANPSEVTPKNVDFAYKPGFKVAIGMNFGHDDWVGKAEYTRLYMSTNTAAAISTNDSPFPNLVVTNWFQPNFGNAFVNRATAKWENDLDLLDGELSRPYYLGNHLILRPFIGPRVAWIHQEYTATLTQTATLSTQKWKYSSWALGPRTGVDINWEVAYGFRFTGDAAWSILYKRQNVKSTFTSSAITTPTDNDFTYRFLRPNTDMSLGFGWGSYFHQHKWHFDLSAAYSFLIFWNENALRQTADFVGTSETPGSNNCNKPGDLFYHGLTANLRIDF